MLTTREMMETIYLRGGEFSEEARAWLADDDDETVAACLIEEALSDYESGHATADEILIALADAAGFELDVSQPGAA
jgi:hypothetical protein